MHASELWEGTGIGPTLARIALAPFSVLYAVGWEAYLAMYRLGIKRPAHPHSPILCVGNLISGGSGKTPVTLHLVRVLRELGYEVVVSCSGYGSLKSRAASLAPDGQLDSRVWGDEAALFRSIYPDLPLIVGRRRVMAAQICHDRHPGAILLLDDGFQHLPLGKDLTILLDPKRPRNHLCLPAGPYREPRWNRLRANLVIPGDFQMVESTSLKGEHGEQVDHPEEVYLLCAIGRPVNVSVALESKGIKVEASFFLPDHDPLDAGTLISNLPNDMPTVVTAKDWVKLRNRADVGERKFLILEHTVTIEPAAEFGAWLQTNLHGIQTKNLPR